MDLSLFFAGTAGSVPTARRGLPALLLRAGGERILFDCGEGTQQQLLRSIGLPDLGSVFITHFHLDHWLGLLGMIKTFDLRARERPLTIHGPPGLHALFASLRPVVGRTGYPLELVELEPHDEVRFGTFMICRSPSTTGSRRTATRSSRTTGRAASTSRPRASWGSSRARTSGACSGGRPWTGSRPSR